MSNELNCEIVKDLMPNYIEGLTSEKTNEFMKNHIESCEGCKKTYLLLSEEYKSEKSLDNNLKEAKVLSSYMNKVKFRNLILGVLLATVILFGGYFTYQEFFEVANYIEPSDNIEVSELYKLNDQYVYFTIKNNSAYECGVTSYGNIEDDNNSIAISMSRTRVGKKISSDLSEEQKNIQSSRSFVIDTKNGEFNLVQSFIVNNPNASKEDIINHVVNGDEKGEPLSSDVIEDVYYIGNSDDDKKLIWQEGMQLPEFP